MSDFEEARARQRDVTSAAIIVLLVLTGVMLLALFSRTEPHPPLEVAPFALGPFLGASLAIGLAAFYLIRNGQRLGPLVAVLFVVTTMVSFGPQKYFDPAFPRIWPAVVTAQLAMVVILIESIIARRRTQSAV